VVNMANFYDMVNSGITNIFSGSEILFALVALMFFAGLAYYFRLNSTLSLGFAIILVWAINGLNPVPNEQLILLLTIMVIGLGIKLAFGFKNALER